MAGSMLEPYLSNSLHGLEALGPWLTVPIYVVALTFFIPGPVLGLAAGAMFGVTVGFLVFTVSSAISAGLVFWAGRHFTRGWVFKKIIASQKIRAIDKGVTKGGWKMVVMLRLAMIVPFSAMNYGLGLSKIPFKHYILATVFAMMPGSLLSAYLGSLAKEIALTGRTPQEKMLEWIAASVGLVVTVGMAIYATKRVKKILTTDPGDGAIHRHG